MVPLRRLALVAVAASFFGASGTALAHHAWTDIDPSRTMTLTGIVKSLQWENPHATLVLETVDGGTNVDWTVMMSAPARMQGRGIDAKMIAVGRPLTVVASPSKNDPHTVRGNRLRIDGRDHVLY